MRRAAITILGGLMAAFLLSGTAQAARWFEIRNVTSSESGVPRVESGLLYAVRDACIGMVMQADTADVINAACGQKVPTWEWTKNSQNYRWTFLSGTSSQILYTLTVNGINPVTDGFNVTTRNIVCPDGQVVLPGNWVCVDPPAPPECEAGDQVHGQETDRPLSFSACINGCAYTAIASSGDSKMLGVYWAQYESTGESCEAGGGMPGPPETVGPGGGCITGNGGKELCIGAGGIGGTVDKQPYGPEDPSEGECRYYSASGSSMWICRGDVPSNDRPRIPSTDIPATPQNQWKQWTSRSSSGSGSSYQQGHGVPGSGSQPGQDGKGTKVELGEPGEGGTCEGDNCPSVSGFGDEELEARKALREGLLEAVEQAGQNAPLEPGFIWWSTGTGQCVGVPVNLGRYGGSLTFDSHCQAYDAWVRPALEWLLYAFAAIYIWGLWYQTVKEVN